MLDNYTNINYYLKLFRGLRDKINYFIYDNTELMKLEAIEDNDLKKFSLMIMYSNDGGKSFRWLLLDDQKEFVIKKLEINDSIKRLAIKPDEFFKIWIKFRLQESGLINYFLQTSKNTEFIKNFTEEKFLISKGYEKDYEIQTHYSNLRKEYRSSLLNNQFDPFIELEKIWGFKDVPFYYVKLPKTKDLQFIAIFPVISLEKNVFFERADFIFTLVKNAVLGANLMKEIIDENLLVLYQQQVKTAIISILIDSYAHNISAHSLAALKWWIELRHKMLDKRFKVPENGFVLSCIVPCLYSIDKNKTKETTEKYYEALGLSDSTYNADYYSLFDFLQFAENDVVKDLFKFASEVIPKEGEKFKFHPRFPVPIDYALYPFFRFLRDKGAFWSGVTRDLAFGGESKTWFKILWEDFANNPLYLGTIAKSEGITKININLEIKRDGELLHKGRFVTIDMSVIDYEEKLSQEPQLDSENYKKLLNNSVKDNTDCTICKDYVELDKYSKYAFVKLGKCFAEFRKILDNEENFRVFLPGGIVGEHALFTIFENTIRNIKHYKDPDTLKNIQENGIDFWISIEGDKLWITKQNDEKVKTNSTKEGSNEVKETKKPELFKVGVWLGHETKLITKEETEQDLGNGKKEKQSAEYLLFNIIDNTLKPILDERSGAPRMGGNSQDKACAAMLFNNKFSSVEYKEKQRDKEYYPWIEFKTLKVGDKEEAGINLEWKENQKVISEESRTQYSNSINNNDDKGYLKKYFYVWRGEDVLDKNALSADEWENPARAKFLISKETWSDEDIIKARKNGIIRLLDGCNDKLRVNELYKKWLEKWLGLNFQNGSIYIGLQSGDNQNILSSAGAIRVKDETIVFYCGSGAESYDSAKTKLKLAHGQEKDFHCNVRSHGAFFQKFFKECNLDTIGGKKINVDDNHNLINDNKEGIVKKETLLLELIESALTKVVIFDNRVNERFKSYTYNKIKMLNDDLFLTIYKEDKQEWENFKKNAEEINFLVIHLSFIESLGYKENIEEFIKNELSFVKNLNENFILVITSGRGRKDWEESIKTTDYEKITIFKTIESILNSIESGISYNDHFDIKYNLIKTLIGS